MMSDNTSCPGCAVGADAADALVGPAARFCDRCYRAFLHEQMAVLYANLTALFELAVARGLISRAEYVERVRDAKARVDARGWPSGPELLA